MGCCTSANEDVRKPSTVKIGQVSPVQSEDKHDHQDTQPKEQQSEPPLIEIQYQKKQQEDNDHEDIPKRKPIPELWKRLQKKQPPYTNHERELIQQLENKIFDQTIDIQYLNELSQSSGRSIIDLLFFINDSGLAIIQLILAYIPNYDIITYLLKDYTLPQDKFELISLDLLHKIKPFKSNVNQVNQSLQFLKELKELDSAQQLIDGLQIEGSENFVYQLDTFIDLKKREQLRLLKAINKLLIKCNIGGLYSAQYQEAKQHYDFKHLKISKSIPQGTSEVNDVEKIVLKELNINIFHQIALENNWNLFLLYSNPYYQTPNISQITPFMIFFQKAPLKTIIEYVEKYPEQLEQGMSYSTYWGFNLIHCLCMNKDISDLEILLGKLQTFQQLETLLIQPYNDQIPLVFYLDCQKNISDIMVTFLSQYKKLDFQIESLINTVITVSQISKYNQKSKFNKYYDYIHKRSSKQDQYIEQNKKRFAYEFSHNTIHERDLDSLIFYHQYIQLAKQIIKRNFTINFPWINNFGIFTCCALPELGTSTQTLLNIMIRKSQFEQVAIQLKLFKEFFLSKAFQQLQQSSYRAQYLVRLISLKKDLRNNPNEEINSEINNTIIQIISEQPQLLFEPLSGYHNFKFFQSKKITTPKGNKIEQFDTLYILLLQLNDQYLIEKCLNFPIQHNWDISIMILQQLFQLKLISKLNDPCSLSLFEYVEKELNTLDMYPELIRQLRVREQRRHTPQEDKFLFIYLRDQTKEVILNEVDQKSYSYCRQFAIVQKQLTKNFLQKIWFLRKELNFTHENLKDKELPQQMIKVQVQEYEELYDWLMAGVRIRVILPKKIVVKSENYKQKVITYWLQKQQRAFCVALSICPESFQDLQSKMQDFEEELNPIFKKNLPLKEILENEAYETLAYLVNQFELSNFKLVVKLAAYYFTGPKDSYYGKGQIYNNQHIESFQGNLRKLLKFFETNSLVLEEDYNQATIPIFLKYIDLQLFIQLDKSVDYLEIVNKQKNITIYDYVRMPQDLKIQQLILSRYFEEKFQELYPFLLPICQLSPNLADLVLQFLSPYINEEANVKYLPTLLNIVFVDNPKLVMDFLFEKIKIFPLPQQRFSYLYTLAIHKKDQSTLNKLLHYFEFCYEYQNFKFTVSTAEPITDDFINYIRALKYPYCLVLSLEQYKSYINEIFQPMEQLGYQLLICFFNGLYEKVELLINKIGDFKKLDKNKFLHIFNMVIINQTIKEFPKTDIFYQNDDQGAFFINNKPYSFFPIPEPSNLVRTRLKNKRSVYEEGRANIAEKYKKLNPRQMAMKEQQEQHRLFYEQEQQYSKQNQNRQAVFVTSGSQNWDFGKGYNLLTKWATLKSLTSMSPIFEFYEALKFPGPKQIKLSTEMKLLLTIYIQSKQPIVLQQKKQYLQLLAACYNKPEKWRVESDSLQSQELDFKKVAPQLKEQFITDLIVENQIYLPSSDDLEYIILRFQNEKLIPVLKKRFRGLKELKFNKSTLFYSRKEVNLLPEKIYDLETQKCYRVLKQRSIYFSKYISGVGVNINKLTPQQVFLIYGKHDHLNKQIGFSYENLLLALVSGNVNTIIYVLNQHQSPKKISLEQNIFQLLIARSLGDAAIMSYFNNFIIDNPTKPSNRLLQLDNVPLLYYIVLTNRRKLFEDCYLKLMVSMLGQEQASEMIKQQLILKPFQDDYDILSIALKKKSYFILEYCSGIITENHLACIDYVDLNLIQNIKAQPLNSKIDQFYNLFTNLFPLCQKLTKFREYTKKFDKYSYKITKQNYIRDQQLNQILTFEKACINYIFDLGVVYSFKNPLLSIELSKDQWALLEYYAYDPELLQEVLKHHRKKDGTISISEDLYCFVIEECQNFKVLDHKIFGELLSLNPAICLRILKPCNITLYLATILYQNHPDTQELLTYIQDQKSLLNSLQEEIEEETEEKIEKVQPSFMQPIVFTALQLLLSIKTNQFDITFINSLNLKIIQNIYEFLDPNHGVKPKITEKAQEFLKRIFLSTITMEDFNLFVEIIEQESIVEKAILKGVLYIKQINCTIEGFFKKLKQEILTINNFSEQCTVFINDQKKIIYSENRFTIPIKFANDSFYLGDSLLEDIIPQLKMMNYNMNIDVELMQFQDQQQEFENFDFSSITTVDFKEIILTEKVNIIEKCVFFKHLMKPLDKVGLYQLDDVFAPHQHEQVRQPDLMHQTSQIHQQPSLIHQQTSQMATSQQPAASRTVNQQQIMKEDFQFMFELLPDNTYQVRQQRYKKNQKELVFAEFYHFIQPKVIVNLEKLSQEDYEATFNGSAAISMIISDFYNYNEFLGNLIDDKPQQQWVNTFPFYIKDQHFVYQEQLFSTYNIQIVFIKLVEFIEKVKSLLGRAEDTSKIVWRINTVSFFEVLVSKLVELEQAKHKIINVYAIMEQIFCWDSLIMILHQLLYNNLVKAQQVLKVIRGVYIEFNECSDAPSVQSNKKGLDRIFSFGNTTYLLYNHILIIRLNVGVVNPEKQQQIPEEVQYKSVFRPNPIMQEYFHNIINEYDFYNQIFSPEQLVQYLFNKLEIDRQLLNNSNQLSKILNKTITLSVDHQSLAQIFEGEISKINRNKKDKNRLKDMEQIWYILQKLNKYFRDDLFNYLQKQLKAEGFDDMFNIRLYCLLLALRQNVPLIQVIVSNTRKLQLDQKSAILQKLSPVTKCDIKLSYQFGFQILKSYFVNNSKLGDVCLVQYCEKQKNNLIACQLVYNSKPGYFLFCKLDSLNGGLLSQERITRNQGHYQTIHLTNSELLMLQIEDLTSIILFQPIWPSDPVFNQSILNVFFTDSDGTISLCNEPKFLTAMNQIQGEQDDFSKQDMLDQLFGPGLVSSYSDLSLTQLTPIFPDQINFDFASIHQLKKQQSMVQGQNVYVRLNGDKFKLDPIEITQVSMACHFETHLKVQSLQKQLIKFLQDNQELQNVYLEFDEQLNEHPNAFTDCILNGNNIFLEFETGYSDFKANQYYPKLNNSLQYIFQIQSIQSIKIDLIRSVIKKIQFIYKKTYGEETKLIDYESETLKLYTLINVDDSIIVPDSSEITAFFFNLILNYQKYNFHDKITGNQSLSILTPTNYQIENSQVIVDIIIILKYLHQLIEMHEPQLKVKILSKSTIQSDFRNTIYQFSGDNELIINYDTFSDFSLCDFFLDYLNNKSFHVKDKYNDKIQYIGPEIVLETLQLNPQQLLSNVENETEISVQVFEFGKQNIAQLEELDPSSFEQAFLIFKIGQVFKKMITLKSSHHQQLLPYFKQESQKQTICNSIHLLVYNLQTDKGIENQLIKVETILNQGNSTTKDNLANILKKQGQKDLLKVNTIFITNNILLLEFFSDKTLKLQLSSSSYEFSIVQQDRKKQINLEYITQNTQDLSKTTHCQVKVNGQVHQVESEQEEQINFGIGDAKLMKILMKKASKKTDEILNHKNCDQIIFTKEMQVGNTINMLSKQELKVATRAGHIRKDYIEFKDNLGNRITNFLYSSIVLVHSLYPQVQYIPDQQKEGPGLDLIWCPLIKGVYKLYIDDVRIKGRFVVLADIPDLDQSEIEIPSQFITIPFYEVLPITFQLRDKWDNVYGDIEYETFADCKCEIQIKNEACKLISTFQKLNKGGQMNANIYFEPIIVETKEEQVELLLTVNKQLKISKQIKLSGICLEKRRKKFEQEINKSFKPSSQNLNIRRMNFLQDLLELADKKMNINFSIKFQDEPGIDAGGLKREFYDMIGNTLKDDTYKFFQPVQGNLGKYFLHNNFNKLKNKEKYALLFGKLIANAIGNTYLIGIDIISPFWKVVYDEQILFEDLKVIWDKQTYENYNVLKTMSEEMLQSLYLDFTYQIGNTTVDLIPNGSKIEVTTKNVEQYLDKTAEYVIYKQFSNIYKYFIEGFSSVLDIDIFKKWLRPSEISLLTQGLLDIKAEVVLSKITYSGGKANHKSYFENYVNQADSQTLKNMLKFITGSSAIPFDQSSYIISVEFKSNLDIRKLPLAHTCFKSIEVPLYNNYAQLKQKLDIAFTIGLEGYGFG